MDRKKGISSHIMVLKSCLAYAQGFFVSLEALPDVSVVVISIGT